MSLYGWILIWSRGQETRKLEEMQEISERGHGNG
jgi:hypothetical protein